MGLFMKMAKYSVKMGLGYFALGTKLKIHTKPFLA
jgi:hypothetical protein